MTYTILELQRFTCDGCGKKEEQTIDKDYCNPIENEQYFIEDLKTQGWTYNKEKDQHFCPKCSPMRNDPRIWDQTEEWQERFMSLTKDSTNAEWLWIIANYYGDQDVLDHLFNEYDKHGESEQ